MYHHAPFAFMPGVNRITVSSLSKEKAIFTLTGPQAGATLELTKYSDLPRPGRFVEHEFRGEKVLLGTHTQQTARHRRSRQRLAPFADELVLRFGRGVLGVCWPRKQLSHL